MLLRLYVQQILVFCSLQQHQEQSDHYNAKYQLKSQNYLFFLHVKSQSKLTLHLFLLLNQLLRRSIHYRLVPLTSRQNHKESLFYLISFSISYMDAYEVKLQDFHRPCLYFQAHNSTINPAKTFVTSTNSSTNINSSTPCALRKSPPPYITPAAPLSHVQ